MTDQPWTPEVLERFETAAGEPVFMVRADRAYDRARPECIGREIVVDGKVWVIAAVHRDMPNLPIWPGEVIGLLARPALPHIGG